MRTILIITMFAASLAHADWKDYEEVRELTLDASGFDELKVDAGAGSMEIRGSSGSDQVRVTAYITVPGKNEEKAQQFVEDHLILTLEGSGDTAKLVGRFDNSNWSWGDSPSVRLEISMPAKLSLYVDDSSGSMVVEGVSGDIEIDDSSGSIRMTDVGGSVKIDDSSGSIRVDGVGGDISVEDGSGSITITEVLGSVTVDDGSGSINVHDVGKDLIIIDDGSGGIDYSNIQGEVEDNS